jgi:hypothetical protein
LGSDFAISSLFSRIAMLSKPYMHVAAALFILLAFGVGKASAKEPLAATGAYLVAGTAGNVSSDEGQKKAPAVQPDRPGTGDRGPDRPPAGPPSAPGTPEELPNGEKAPTKKADEIQQLKERIIKLQNEAKLGFRKVVACSSVEGFGIYSPLQAGKPVPRIFLYIEPANYSTMVSDSRYIVDCSFDLAIFSADGKMLGGHKGKLSRISRSPVLDLFVGAAINLNKPFQGDLVVKIVLRDNIKNDSVGATYRINIESGKRTLQEGV